MIPSLSECEPSIRGVMKPQNTLQVHNEAITGVRYSYDGEFVATVSSDASVDIWKTGTTCRAANFSQPHYGKLIDLAFHQHSKYLSLAYSKGVIKRFDLVDGRELHSAIIEDGSILDDTAQYDGRFSKYGNMIVGSYSDDEFNPIAPLCVHAVGGETIHLGAPIHSYLSKYTEQFARPSKGCGIIAVVVQYKDKSHVEVRRNDGKVLYTSTLKKTDPPILIICNPPDAQSFVYELG